LPSMTGGKTVGLLTKGRYLFGIYWRSPVRSPVKSVSASCIFVYFYPSFHQCYINLAKYLF
jgi:hypothetical protein